MRNIHAELEQWDYDAPTRWEPSPGDILIGVVNGCSSFGTGKTLESVTVQEEETGLLVLVVLDSPNLANLVKLQRPQVGERIGIKCTNLQAGGERHYVLMVDRGEPEASPQSDKASEDYDEEEYSVGTTDEERSFIEQALLENTFTSELIPTHPVERDAGLREIIQRQDDQIARQTDSVRELERMLASAIPLIGKAQEPEAIQEPKRKPRISSFSLVMIFVTSCSLALAGYLTYVQFWATQR